MRITESQLRRIIREELSMEENDFTYAAAKAAVAGKKSFKFGGEEHPVKMSKAQAEKIVDENDFMSEVEEAKDKSGRPKAYGAPEGSKRDKQLDATKTDLASGDPARIQRAYRRREKMEKSAREKPGFENKPRSDSQKEGVTDVHEGLLEVIQTILSEELSKKTKETLKKKAEKRGLTPGSVYAEFKKGLAAWATSGSRKGMAQHQWALARVNSANPSKSGAVVRKS